MLNEEQQSFFATYDFTSANLRLTSICIQDLLGQMKRTVSSDLVIFFLDAGFAGPTNKILQGTGYRMISACGPEEQSWESKRYQNSVFCHHLLGALSENDGKVELGVVYDQTRQQVAKEVESDRRAIQNPQKSGDWSGGKLCLACVPTGSQGQAEAQDPTSLSLAAPMPMAIDPSTLSSSPSPVNQESGAPKEVSRQDNSGILLEPNFSQTASEKLTPAKKYIQQVEHQIRANWEPCPGKSGPVTLRFCIDKSGNTSHPEVTCTSGSATVDLSAKLAIEHARPFTAPPAAPFLLEASFGDPATSPIVRAQSVDFGPYMTELQRKIKRAWAPPRGLETRRVRVVFTINENGKISNLHVSKSSGSDSADEAGLAAVKKSAPFAHLPPGSPASVDLMFTFDYNTFAQSRAK